MQRQVAGDDSNAAAAAAAAAALLKEHHNVAKDSLAPAQRIALSCVYTCNKTATGFENKMQAE